MSSTQPTPEQTALAAELAPRVAALLPSLEWQTFEEPHEVELLVENPKDCLSMEGLLHPSVFQAVLLALPPSMERFALLTHKLRMQHSRLFLDGDTYFCFEQWLLTPAGMLAFYEALVAQEDTEQ